MITRSNRIESEEMKLMCDMLTNHSLSLTSFSVSLGISLYLYSVSLCLRFHSLMNYYYRHVYTHRFINTIFTVVVVGVVCCYFWFEYIKNRLYPKIWKYIAGLCLASPSQLWLNENLLALQAVFFLLHLSLSLCSIVCETRSTHTKN